MIEVRPYTEDGETYIDISGDQFPLILANVNRKEVGITHQQVPNPGKRLGSARLGPTSRLRSGDVLRMVFLNFRDMRFEEVLHTFSFKPAVPRPGDALTASTAGLRATKAVIGK